MSRLRCQACWATIDYTITVTRQPSSDPTVAVFHVHTDTADVAWLRLFDEAHRGPLELAR